MKARTAARDTSGVVIDERYELGPLLGRGGMADVYAAWDRRLDRRIALKILRPQLAGDDRFFARFRREARAAAALAHPQIATIHDAGIHEDLPYIAMEHVEGRTLAEVLSGDGPLAPDRAARVGIAVARALASAHAAGIVHRDLKPANIMLTGDGRLKVVDFGIAWAAGWTPIDDGAAVPGTPEYLSPEQARGEEVDGRSDIYSLGVVLYELLIGRPPFVGDTPLAVAYRHVEEAPTRPEELRAGVPAALAAIVMRALAKSPHDRYRDAEEMRLDLVRFLAGEPPRTARIPRVGATDPLPTGPTEERPPRRGRRLRWGIPILLALLLAGVGAVMFRAGPSEPSSPARPPALYAPTVLSAHESCDGFMAARVTLRWVATSSAFADGYEVYRGTEPGGPYERVAWVPGRNATSFVDDGLRPGRTYVYGVRSTAGTRASAVSVQAETRTPFACLW